MMIKKKTTPAMSSGVQKDAVQAVTLDESDPSDVESDSETYSLLQTQMNSTFDILINQQIL